MLSKEVCWKCFCRHYGLHEQHSKGTAHVTFDDHFNKDGGWSFRYTYCPIGNIWLHIHEPSEYCEYTLEHIMTWEKTCQNAESAASVVTSKQESVDK